MHRQHPPVQTNGLADECEGCDEIAENPFQNADYHVFRDLVRLAVNRERLAAGRSTAELVASATILTSLERAGKIAQECPAELEAYLRERWRIRCRIEGVA